MDRVVHIVFTFSFILTLSFRISLLAYVSFLLDEPQAQKAMGKISKDMHAFDIFMCWIEILEFKQIPSGSTNYRYSKAVDIYHKYIEKHAVLEIGGKHTSLCI